MDHSETNKSNFIICGVCKKRFKTKYLLNVHKRVHSGENPYKCDICAKNFTLKASVKLHMLVHSGKKDFQCHVCGKCFTLKNKLKKSFYYPH